MAMKNIQKSITVLAGCLLGGRPMNLVQKDRIIDPTDGRPVHLYQDRRGKYWVSRNRWGTLRVPASAPKATQHKTT